MGFGQDLQYSTSLGSHPTPIAITPLPF